MSKPKTIGYMTVKNDSSNSGLPSYFPIKNPGALSMCSKMVGLRLLTNGCSQTSYRKKQQACRNAKFFVTTQVYFRQELSD